MKNAVLKGQLVGLAITHWDIEVISLQLLGQCCSRVVEDNPGHCRAFSIMSVLGKLLEKILRTTIYLHLEEKELIWDSQPVFVCSKRCRTNLIETKITSNLLSLCYFPVLLPSLDSFNIHTSTNRYYQAITVANNKGYVSQS